MTVTNYNELKNHAGHAVEIVVYGDEAGVALECLDCNEVLLDFNLYDDNPVESKNTLFIEVSGTAVVRSDGSKINIVSASKDGEWYTDDREWLFSRSKLKYIRIDLDSQ